MPDSNSHNGGGPRGPNGQFQRTAKPAVESVGATVDPVAAAAAAGAPAEPPRSHAKRKDGTAFRGAPGRGTQTAREAPRASLDLSGAAGLLQGIHAVVAMGRGPHWLLADNDAKAYGAALANALRHLPVQMAQKYIDFSMLGVAIVTFEGVRVAEDIRLSRLPPSQRGRPGGPARVFQFRTPSPAPEPTRDSPHLAPVPASPPTPFVDMTYEPELSQ